MNATATDLRTATIQAVVSSATDLRATWNSGDLTAHFLQAFPPADVEVISHRVTWVNASLAIVVIVARGEVTDLRAVVRAAERLTGGPAADVVSRGLR